MKKIIISTITVSLISLCIIYALLIKSEHAASEVKHADTTYNYFTITQTIQSSGEYLGKSATNNTEIKFKSDQKINVGDTVKVYFWMDGIEKIEVVD